jgi:hypothetical protein
MEEGQERDEGRSWLRRTRKKLIKKIKNNKRREKSTQLKRRGFLKVV